MRKLLAIWKDPIPPEMQALLAARWRELPDDLKLPHQTLGRQLVHCGYTMGAAYCSFGCTHCYLPRNANRVPIPSLDEMKAQIDANRRLMGATGGLQITGGDVVDAYWQNDRADELVEIVRYAHAAGVQPMLMTHGQVLLENPDYLARLVRVGGLRKLAIHIDVTQAGRPGFPIRELESESDLHPLRERFVDLLFDVRRRTGVSLHAAHTVTVTERNLGSIAEILRWLIADPRRIDAFRMVSFQTEAAVGRTRFSVQPVTPESTWSEVCAGVGRELARDNLLVGHPECSNFTTLLALYPERRVIDLIPADPATRAYATAFLETFQRIGATGQLPFEGALRRLALIARRPAIIAETWRYLAQRLRQEGLTLAELGWR
ncbi:MAG: hypothetical protein HC897_04390, partial [Thermoanaerobaculia bacterium]|nr:hypothetical protein [Thermoanaerobaculia bacterium]